MQDLMHPGVGRGRLGMDLETDLSGLPIDQLTPKDRIPKGAKFNKAFFDDILGLMQDGTPTLRPTLRDIYLRYERARKTITETPKRVADVMEEWFTGGGG